MPVKFQRSRTERASAPDNLDYFARATSSLHHCSLTARIDVKFDFNYVMCLRCIMSTCKEAVSSAWRLVAVLLGKRSSGNESWMRRFRDFHRLPRRYSVQLGVWFRHDLSIQSFVGGVISFVICIGVNSLNYSQVSFEYVILDSEMSPIYIHVIFGCKQIALTK